MATLKPTSRTTRPRAAKPKAPAKTPQQLETVRRKIGAETHDWCSDLGGIPRPFGAPVEASHAVGEADGVAVSQPAPHAPVDGKIPALELTPLGGSTSENAEDGQ